jgi:hypothetical protein
MEPKNPSTYPQKLSVSSCYEQVQFTSDLNKRLRSNRGAFPGICLEEFIKITKTTVRVTDSEYLPSTDVECYRFTGVHSGFYVIWYLYICMIIIIQAGSWVQRVSELKLHTKTVWKQPAGI